MKTFLDWPLDSTISEQVAAAETVTARTNGPKSLFSRL